jgi:hypothetical protein
MTVRTLAAPSFTDEEQSLIVTDLLALKKTKIAEFLGQNRLLRSGTKEEIRVRVEEALDDGSLSLTRIVQFLDEVVPWGKQHVYLYDGPKSPIANWRRDEWVSNLLKKHRLGKYLNASLPLILPDKMKLSSVLHDEDRLRISAVKKRDWWERDPDYDDDAETRDGDEIELRAFIHRVTRSLVAFEWDLVSNTAFLQISQLPSKIKYEKVAEEFFGFVSEWLDVKQFSVLDLGPVIKNLHKLEESGAGETRSHGIRYRMLDGRSVEGKSGSPADPLVGDTVIDALLGTVRDKGNGHHGNFYWLNGESPKQIKCPLEDEAHVIVVGDHNRVSFPTPNDEETVRYVLSRIRSHCS